MEVNRTSVGILLKYLSDDEKKFFEEEYDTEVVANIDEQIRWCEEEGVSDNAFYALMIIKRAYDDCNN